MLPQRADKHSFLLQSDAYFAQIADDISSQGFSIQKQALPEPLVAMLADYQQSMHLGEFSHAGIGREHRFQEDKTVRKDAICWIDGTSEAGSMWLSWAEALKTYLNRELFMGLFSFESHFAHYAPGAFYKRHLDAFRGQSNRVLSLVTYLNNDWSDTDGGELVIYQQPGDKEGMTVLPQRGTVVVFLSEQFEHEVRPALRNRNSIAGWFRVNSSLNGKIDPPR